MFSLVLNFLSNLPKELITFIIAMLPIFELRGSIPFGFSVGLGLKKTLILSIVGNLVPVMPILFLLEPVSTYLRRFSVFKRFFDWFFANTKRKANLIEKYESLGLIIFVAIPLPATGAWTGCIAASLFKMRLRYAFFSIAMGVIIAALIVTSVWNIGKGVLYHLFISYH